MKELNYIPNELARNLLSKKSGIVAIIIPKISHPFFAEVVLYAEAELMKKGYKTMICSTYSEQNYEKEYINMLNRHIVDGIIAGSHMLDFEEYQGVQGPIVALDRFLGENIPVVSTNHKIGGKLAAEELVRNNCRCVLQIQGARVVDSPSHERHYEFERYMKKRGVTVYSHEMDWNDFDYGQYDVMADMLVQYESEGNGIIYFGRENQLLAIIAVTDAIKSTSSEAVKELRRQGIDICMLTGDGQRTALAVAGKLGIDRFIADALPDDKEDFIRELQLQGKTVAMVGDGINERRDGAG